MANIGVRGRHRALCCDQRSDRQAELATASAVDAPRSPVMARRCLRQDPGPPFFLRCAPNVLPASGQVGAKVQRSLPSRALAQGCFPVWDGSRSFAADNTPGPGGCTPLVVKRVRAARASVGGHGACACAVASAMKQEAIQQARRRAGSPTVMPDCQGRRSMAAKVLPAARAGVIPLARQLLLKPAQTASGTPRLTEATQQAIDVEPWLHAARKFKMNTDFALTGLASTTPCLNLTSLMDMMKAESGGKPTIQALADKIMLSQIMDNLDIPHLPNLLALWDEVCREDVARLIDREVLEKADPDYIVLKPTHLSSGAGVCSISTLRSDERDEVVDWLTNHMQEFMALQAAPHESVALQSLRPGFVAQPRYEATVRFQVPLELRVLALWGEVRMGIWWWGHADGKSEHAHRNVWIVRQPRSKDELSDQDEWKVIHGHPGSNPGFDQAIEIFKRHMKTMVAYSEQLATAVGAPFLRADFFVGSSKWGVRLNEVAYGCGCDYRNCVSERSGKMFDDAPAMAQILQEGMALCKARLPASNFLSGLGARGKDYGDMEVLPMKRATNTPPQPLMHPCHEDPIVPEELCKTPRKTATTPVLRATASPSIPEVAVLKSSSPQSLLRFEARSRSVEPHMDLFSGSGSTPSHSMARHPGGSFDISRSDAMSLSLQHRRNSGALQAQAADRMSASVSVPMPMKSKRTLVARAVSAKTRDHYKHEPSSRERRIVARIGGA